MKNIIMTLLLSTILYSASFDCSKASTGTEKTICNNDDLSQLDSELALIYKKNSILRLTKNLLTEQKEWINNRNKCSSISCLNNLYTNRIFELQHNLHHYHLNLIQNQLPGEYYAEYETSYEAYGQPNRYDYHIDIQKNSIRFKENESDSVKEYECYIENIESISTDFFKDSFLNDMYMYNTFSLKKFKRYFKPIDLYTRLDLEYISKESSSWFGKCGSLIIFGNSNNQKIIYNTFEKNEYPSSGYILKHVN